MYIFRVSLLIFICRTYLKETSNNTANNFGQKKELS